MSRCSACFLAAYVGLEWASFMHEHNDLPVTPWNPGLGIAFGLMILKGARFGLALFAGVVLAEILVLQTELAWPIVLSIGLVVSASYAAAADVARRLLRLDVGLAHVRDLGILLAAGVAGAAVSAALLIVLLRHGAARRRRARQGGRCHCSSAISSALP